MASKQGYEANLVNYLEKRLEIRLNGGRTVRGKLRGYDPFMNLVLEDCIEKIKYKNSTNGAIEEREEKIGTIMIRGNSVVLWECIDKITK